MGLGKLITRNTPLETPYGPVIGTSFRWPGGQYCAIHTARGLVGCGIYDVHIAGEFGLVVAIARGTPENPLSQPEELLTAKIAEVTAAAEKIGIHVGMLGQDALNLLLQS